MKDKYFSEFGKTRKTPVEDTMSTRALTDAKEWADLLLNNEFKGRGDKDYLARYRLSQRLGVKESYLFRLQYKTAEMRDVAGEVYRRIREAYDELCANNEAAAERMRSERLELRSSHEANPEPAEQAEGMDSP